MKIIYNISDQTTVIGDKPETIEKGETLSLTLQANTGYKFDPVPLVAIRTTSFQYINTNFVLDSTGKKATISYEIPSNASTCTIKAFTVESSDPVPETVTVTNNLVNCSSSLNDSTVIKGKEIRITLTANKGYSFSGLSPFVKWETEGTPSTNFNVSEDKLSATVTITPNDNFTIEGNAYVIKTFVNVTYKLNNCTSSLTGETVEKGKEITVTVTANENAQFDGITPNVYYLEHGIPKTVNFTLDETKKTGTLTFTPNYNFTLNADANVIEPVAKNYGAINVYKVSLKNLDSFSKKRFSKVKDETTGTTETVNLGVYVNRIKRIFTNVPVSGTDVLKCGNYNTGITVEAPQTDVVTLDFGNVTLTGLNGNNADYDSVISVFIPCRGFVPVDSSYIGKTINLSIKVNVITGDSVAFLSCDGITFQLESFSLSRDVIYRTGDNDLNIVGGDKWDEQILYGFEPYILITANKTVDTVINNTQKPVTIGDVTGYAQFENVDLNTVNLLVDEYNTIISELENGVYL